MFEESFDEFRKCF